MRKAYKSLDSFVEWWGNGTPSPIRRKKRKRRKKRGKTNK